MTRRGSPGRSTEWARSPGIRASSRARWTFIGRPSRFPARSASQVGKPGLSSVSGMFSILRATWRLPNERTKKPSRYAKGCRTRAGGRALSTRFPACSSTWKTSEGARAAAEEAMAIQSSSEKTKRGGGILPFTRGCSNRDRTPGRGSSPRAGGEHPVRKVSGDRKRSARAGKPDIGAPGPREDSAKRRTPRTAREVSSAASSRTKGFRRKLRAVGPMPPRVAPRRRERRPGRSSKRRCGLAGSIPAPRAADAGGD